MANPHPASPQARESIVLGVIGGSGLYEMEELRGVEQVTLSTPFGEPSAAYTVGELERGSGTPGPPAPPAPPTPPIKAVFLPRHGIGHVLTPGEINYRANAHGFKQLGVTHLLSISAVGSLREEVAPGHVVTPDQFIDRTKARESSFFEAGAVAHVQFGDPTTDSFRARINEAARAEGATVHEGGTLVVMEGPAFSTRAESELYRSWGARIIGMTALPEAKLAREAEMAYAVLALSTDYDCWHESEDEVSVDAVLAIVKKNVTLARAVVKRLAAGLPERCEELPYPRALEGALATNPRAMPAVTRERLDLIIGHYL